MRKNVRATYRVTFKPLCGERTIEGLCIRTDSMARAVQAARAWRPSTPIWYVVNLDDKLNK